MTRQSMTNAPLQALETNLAAGGHLDTYEFEGPDRAEFVQDLAEFQLAAVRQH